MFFDTKLVKACFEVKLIKLNLCCGRLLYRKKGQRRAEILFAVFSIAAKS